MTEQVLIISETALALLRHTKRVSTYFAQESVIEELREVLGPIYHPKMKLLDMLRVTLNALLEIKKEPRFQISDSDFIMELLKAPIRQVELKLHGTRETIDEHALTLTDVITSQIIHMLQVIRMANVGWCRETLSNGLKK